jgi:hypothetical protein
MKDLLAIVGGAVVFFPVLMDIAILTALWRGWWLYPAWTWYIVPLGAPAVSFWHATALLLLVGHLTQHTPIKKDNRPTDWGALISIYLGPILVWAVLWWMR